MSTRSQFSLAAVLCATVLLSVSALGQSPGVAETANIIGTVTDVNGQTVASAEVVLRGPDSSGERTVMTSESGFFQFRDLASGVAYRITVRAREFADWTSPEITLDPGQFKIMTGIQLRIVAVQSEVRVTYDPVVVATQQFNLETHQRVFGFLPNFFVNYDQDNAAPLTAKMKFKLALKVSTDPVTAAGVFFVASARQAGNSPRYGQGWDAYGKRVGATAADGFSDIMIGGAILPTLLHQDPRYFYQGTGTTGSRIRHAAFSPFVAKYDDGHWGPNFSSLGGDLASSALANLYYPKADRGAGLVFGNFAIGTAERIGASLAQEFLLSKYTKRGGKVR